MKPLHDYPALTRKFEDYFRERPGKQFTNAQLRRIFGVESSTVSNIIRKLQDKHPEMEWHHGGKYVWKPAEQNRVPDLHPWMSREFFVLMIDRIVGGMQEVAVAIEEQTQAIKEQTDKLVNDGIVMK